jgi:hypothetical protein
MNPDDFEFITLAERRGIGIGDLSKITLKGQPVDRVAVRFEKKPDQRARFGQSNRTWLLKGPFPIAEKRVIDPQGKVVLGQDGWSEAVYFGDDKIDLRTYSKEAVNCVAYACTELTAPRSQEAELWVGSGEGLTVWIDGVEVYQFTGTRQHRLPNDKPKIKLTEGRHVLLVRVEQTRGAFDFSLNICEPETDERYSGNRIVGLTFAMPSMKEVAQVRASEARGFMIEEWLGGSVPDWLESGTWVTFTAENGFPLKDVSSLTFFGGGVCRFDGKRWNSYTTFNSNLKDNHLMAIAADARGHIWAGADAGGIARFDGERWVVWGRESGLSENSARAIAVDPNGNVWVVTGVFYGPEDSNAIGMFDGKRWTTGLSGESVNCIAIDPEGNVWFGSQSGLAKLSIGKMRK